jgi:CP family cyanate transporter-like MFS transporter
LLVINRTSKLLPTAVALTAVLLAAANMRVGIVQVGPVVEQVRADTGMSSTVAGLLGTIPFVCFGVFAFGGAPLIRRIGMNATVAWSLVLIAAGTAGRAFVEPPALLLALTVPIGVGVALLGVALPAVIKHRFATRAAGVLGAYVAALSGGAAITALLTVPLSESLGGWREAFAVAALLAVLPLPLWMGPWAGEEPPRRPAEQRSSRPDRQTIALALAFGLQSVTFAAMINWLAAVYIDAGWTEHQASLAVATLPLQTCAASLLIPVLTSAANRPFWVFATGLAIAIGLTGIALAPTTLPVLWLLISGFGIGAIFPLVLTLPLDLHDDPSRVADVTGWMLGLGYLLSAAGPALVGALRDLTGGFTIPVLVIAASGLAAGLIGLAPSLRRPRL